MRTKSYRIKPPKKKFYRRNTIFSLNIEIYYFEAESSKNDFYVNTVIIWFDLYISYHVKKNKN